MQSTAASNFWFHKLPGTEVPERTGQDAVFVGLVSGEMAKSTHSPVLRREPYAAFCPAKSTGER